MKISAKYREEKNKYDLPNELKKFTPDRITTSEIHFKNIFPEWINMIRRVMMTELPVKCMVVESIECNDKRVLTNMVSNKITQIPINQDFEYSDMEFQLNVKNEHQESVSIRSSMIRLKSKFKKKVEMGDCFNGLYRFCMLATGCTLTINIKIYEITPSFFGVKPNIKSHYDINTHVAKMIGGNPAIIPMNIDEKNPTFFDECLFTVQNCGNTSMRYIFEKMKSVITARCFRVLDELKNMKDDEDYISTDITYFREIDNKKFIFKNEGNTVISCIAGYALLDGITQLKFGPKVHPENPEFEIQFSRSIDAVSLIKKYFKKIIESMTIFNDLVK